MDETVIGVKTGFTDEAGRCLVSASVRNGITLICVTLNDRNDWQDHEVLYDYGFGQLSLQEVTFPADWTLPVTGGTTGTAAVAPAETLTVGVKDGNMPAWSYQLNTPPFLYAPLTAGQEAGTWKLLLDGRVAAQGRLLVQSAVTYQEKRQSRNPEAGGNGCCKNRAKKESNRKWKNTNSKTAGRCRILFRRQAEKLISDGKVKVNGHPVKLGDKATLADLITVGGERVYLPRKKQYRYLMLYKPRGYVTTTSDELNRRCVMDLLEDVEERVYPVGRLDKDSEGLLLLTNDGSFANGIMHPSRHISKTYRVTVRPDVTEEQLIALSGSMELDGKMTQPATVVCQDQGAGACRPADDHS